MELAAVFDPTNSTSGQFTASTLQVGSTMIIDNKSYVDLIFTFASGDQRLIIANDRRAFQFSDASSVPGPFVTWKQQNIDYPQTINQLQNICYVEIYAPTEKVIETYPNPIQRETLPSLVPYNVGYGAGVVNFNHASDPPVVWPTSYYGITVAPKISAGGININGMGFDYFWTESNMSAASTVMSSLPGNYSTTQKSTNDATLNNTTLASNIPGPFSKPGLAPVDSATYLNGTYWTCASSIPWASASGSYYIDLWVNIPQTSFGHYVSIFGDDDPIANNKGVLINMNPSGNVMVSAAFTGGAVTIGNGTLSPDNWHYIQVYWKTGTLQFYIDGNIVGSAATSGTPVNSTLVLSIGSDTFDGGSFVGSIANVGILLSDITATQWGVNAIQARYQLGLQSLTIDMQNVWITEIEIIHQTGATATTGVSSVILDDIFNPGGLLYANVPVNVNALHIWRDVMPVSPIWSFGVQAVNEAVTITESFQKPLTHVFDKFPILTNTNVSTVAAVTATIKGYNILAVG